MKVLIAEDDQNTRDGLAEVLANEGYDVVTAPSGDLAFHLFLSEKPDFVCLDIMMPGRSGYEVCKQIREASPETPIVFISAKTEEADKLVGFDLGADDFIEKPFSVREVTARIRAVTRRCFGNRDSRPSSFEMGELEISPTELRARRGEETIELSYRDVQLLSLFHERTGEALDRNTIFNVVWNEDYFPNSRTLDQHISQLRKKIEDDPKKPKLIQTVHGVGYRYDG